MRSDVNRRDFLRAASVTVTAGLAGSRLARPVLAADNDGSDRRPICVFTKPFNSLSFGELAEAIAELGFTGIEAPIRRGGHVEPEQIEDRLPPLVEALAKHGLQITVMTSDVNDPSDPLSERVLRTAAGLGIRRYRMKYYRYDADRPIRAQLDQWRSQMLDLAAMNRELGIRGLYQNHAGARQFGAPLWDLARVLEGIPMDEIGVAYDIRHATVEGGASWPTTFRMIRPHVDTVYVKDFRWRDGKAVNVPLGQGRVSRSFFDLLAESDFTGPISLHEEYLDHRRPELVPEHLAAIRRDFATLRDWLAG